MTDADHRPHRPVRSAAARIAARYSSGQDSRPAFSDAASDRTPTATIDPVVPGRTPVGPDADGDRASTTTPDLAGPEDSSTSRDAGPESTAPLGVVRDEDTGPRQPGDTRDADLVPLSTPDTTAVSRDADTSSTAARSTAPAPEVARLPGLASGGRFVHVLGLVGVGLVTAAALLVLPSVVSRLTAVSSRQELIGMVLVVGGALALVGFSRWLDHVLSGRLAQRYAESLLVAVVERSADHPAAVPRLAVHALRAVREGVSHLHARLIPLVVVLAGAAFALTRVHPSLALVAAAPFIMLGAVAAAVSTSASRAVRDERRARHDVTESIAGVVAPPEPVDVDPVHSHTVRPDEDLVPEPGEDAVSDTLDPVEDDEALAAARARSTPQATATVSEPGAPLPDHVRSALGRLADAESRSTDAVGSLRAVGTVVVGAALAAVAAAAYAAGVPAGEIAGALVVTGVAVLAAVDVAEGARFAPAMSDARRTVGRALAGGDRTGRR